MKLVTIGQTSSFKFFWGKYSLVVTFLMICSMCSKKERVESMCTPSNLYVVTLATVCDATLGKGELDDQVPFLYADK